MSAAPHAPVTPGFEGIYEKSLDCVHCGLCLSSCPTYVATGRENSSPRGRIYLMRGVAEGRVELGPLLGEEAFLCLGCRACETACPSGVQYGAMLEETRDLLVSSGEKRGFGSWLEKTLLRELVPHAGRLRFVVGALGWVQRLRLDRLAIPLLPAKLRETAEMAPRVPPARERRPLPQLTPAQGEQRGRVALLTGCIMPELFGRVHHATIRVLSQQGFEVVVPPAQGCCGALQAHSGDLETARELARKNVSAFGDVKVDAVIVNSAGCGAAMRDVEHWLGPNGAASAKQVRDVCEWLAEVGWRGEPGRLEARVCYDAPCHLVHGQRVDAAPRELLGKIEGLELVAHAQSNACCGAAGIYNLTHREMSQLVLARKLDALGDADPDIVASGNPGCLMQLETGLRSRGLHARTAHPIELMAEALG